MPVIALKEIITHPKALHCYCFCLCPPYPIIEFVFHCSFLNFLSHDTSFPGSRKEKISRCWVKTLCSSSGYWTHCIRWVLSSVAHFSRDDFGTLVISSDFWSVPTACRAGNKPRLVSGVFHPLLIPLALRATSCMKRLSKLKAREILQLRWKTSMDGFASLCLRWLQMMTYDLTFTPCFLHWYTFFSSSFAIILSLCLP